MPRPRASGAAAQAEGRLRGRGCWALTHVSCECHDGVLTLRGSLANYYLKQLAQAAVEHVVNEIEVVAPAPTPR